MTLRCPSRSHTESLLWRCYQTCIKNNQSYNDRLLHSPFSVLTAFAIVPLWTSLLLSEENYWNKRNSWRRPRYTPSENCWHNPRRLNNHCAIALGLPQNHKMSVLLINSAWAWCGNLMVSLQLLQEPRIILGHKWLSKILHWPYNQRVVPAWGLWDVICDVSMGYGLAVSS